MIGSLNIAIAYPTAQPGMPDGYLLATGETFALRHAGDLAGRSAVVDEARRV